MFGRGVRWVTDNEVILALLLELADRNPEPEGLALLLAHACRTVLGVDGAAITIETTSPHRTTLCATDAVAARLEDLQEVTGEGPCRDAYRLNVPIVVTVGHDAANRWPSYTPASLQAVGPLTAHSFPMRDRGLPYGTITMYSARDHTLHESPATAQLVVDAIGARLARVPADVLIASEDLATSRATVHQATGMIIAQADIPDTDALALLRAHAHATDKTLADVAEHVVDRSLAFTDLTHPN
jgi:hypothetical protein